MIDKKRMNEKRSNKEAKTNLFLLFSFVLSLIVVMGFVIGVSWSTPIGDFEGFEDSSYYYDLSDNLTSFNNDVEFEIMDTTTYRVHWTNISGTYNVSKETISPWISIINLSTGNLSINATHDNQTGRFGLDISAKNTTSETTDSHIITFTFILNATNDAPEFIDINQEYNMTYNMTETVSFSEYINASDEEEHYPMDWNITWINCSHASWSDRSNCSLFNFSETSNESALMNYTPKRNDVGTYWVNVTITDTGGNCSLSSGYCKEDYNETQSYTETIKFNVFSTVHINVSDCANKTFMEGVTGTCIINVTTKGEEDLLNISSDASIGGRVYNTSWFYGTQQHNSSNFTYPVLINVTPGKTEVGNWSIEFNVDDLTADEAGNESFNIDVARNPSLRDSPNLNVGGINNSENISMEQEKIINLTVVDEDFKIPDKNYYNETIDFTGTVLNQSNLSQNITLSDFSISVGQMPVLDGTYYSNYVNANITFSGNESEIGDYTINISVNDTDGNVNYTMYNFSIISNNAPQWNSSLQTEFVINESENFYLNLSQNVSDANNDSITFSYTNVSGNDILSGGFNTSTGEINITPEDVGVGEHLINMTASDSYLTNTTQFNFTVLNVNDAPWISNETDKFDVQVDMNNDEGFDSEESIFSGNFTNLTTQEDNYTKILFYLYDDDFLIPDSQIQNGFYNETPSLNVSFVNLTETFDGDLFNFSSNSPIENYSTYIATFTPNKTHIGYYNITLNITDSSNVSSSLTFSLNITEKKHDPVLSNLSDRYNAVNRTLYYDINATDTEDGNESSGNLEFSYVNVSGRDIIADAGNSFNSTTGVLNITNISEGGEYEFNVSVNDSDNMADTKSFKIYVYDAPNLDFPSNEYEFSSLTENSTSNLTFRFNHSVGDNLTYEFYIDSVEYNPTNDSNFTYGNLTLRDNLSYYGNNTNLSWEFPPSFTDETYGKLKNLTVIVYPSQENLSNASFINSSFSFNFNISHANAPVVFNQSIGKYQSAWNEDIQINLSNYFYDNDYADSYYNSSHPDANVNFEISNSSKIIAWESNWVLTLHPRNKEAFTEFITINASDNSTYDTSNPIEIEFTEPVTETVPTPSGGGSSPTPVAFKLIAPGEITGYLRDRIEIPLKLQNTGDKRFTDIKLFNSVFKDNELFDDVEASFDESEFDELGRDETKNVTLTVYFDTNKIGDYKILVNATSERPEYEDWAEIHISLQRINESEARELLIFTEEYIAQNPECAELTELVEEAREYYEKGDFVQASVTAEKAVNGCKEAISQVSKPFTEGPVGYVFNEYFIYALIGSVFLGLTYYFIQRRRFRKSIQA